ncbi:MAG: hypothetical protein MUP58_01870 [Candidatus Nanohaloarchaeota archaeon QJJ-9]|nr:hypothetical protein [Candidatus Nanohaloarchaeota archaeon QJJ-9]
MSMDFDSQVTTGMLIGVLMAVFFVAGFIVSGMAVDLGENGQGTNDVRNGSDLTDGNFVSQEESLKKAQDYLMAQLPPFVSNATTVRAIKDSRVEGTRFLYNWTVGFTVEPNSFGEWATNNTTTKTYNFYVSPNGSYVFTAPPQETEVQSQSGPVYSGP